MALFPDIEWPYFRSDSRNFAIDGEIVIKLTTAFSTFNYLKWLSRAVNHYSSPTLQAEVLAQSEALFNAMLERLMHEKRLTVKTISTEVARLLAVAGLADSPHSPQDAAPGPERTLPVRTVLTNFQRLNLAQLTAPELAEVVTVAQAQVRLAQARLKTLGTAPQ